MLCESNGQSSRIPNWFDENAGLCVTIGLGKGAIELYWNSGLMRQRGLARKKKKKRISVVKRWQITYNQESHLLNPTVDVAPHRPVLNSSFGVATADST
jgi:hypothetical protein